MKPIVKEYIDYDLTKKEDEEQKKIMTKIEDLEKKILNFVNFKLNIELTGNEIKLDLNNLSINDSELMLISGIKFNNLEELDLSHNNITDIRILKEFNLKNIKKIDLSFNKIITIKNPHSHSIKNKYSNNFIEINLDQNNLLKKDIEDLKNIIKYPPNDNDYIKNEYNINNQDIMDNNINKDDKKKLLNKLDSLKKKVLGYFNNKLNIFLTGKEVIINLNGKNIQNIDLSILSNIEFNNLNEINLSHNNLSNIEPLINFTQLKTIDLSFNKIIDIKGINKILEKNKQIKNINLSYNDINNIEVLKENISEFPRFIEINLDNNKIIQKDIDEIKNIIKEKILSQNTNITDDFRNNYDILGTISDNEFVIVYKVKDKNSDNLRAVKCLKKNMIISQFIRSKVKCLMKKN